MKTIRGSSVVNGACCQDKGPEFSSLTHLIEEDQIQQVVLWTPHKCCGTYTHSCMYACVRSWVCVECGKQIMQFLKGWRHFSSSLLTPSSLCPLSVSLSLFLSIFVIFLCLFLSCFLYKRASQPALQSSTSKTLTKDPNKLFFIYKLQSLWYWSHKICWSAMEETSWTPSLLLLELHCGNWTPPLYGPDAHPSWLQPTDTGC